MHPLLERTNNDDQRRNQVRRTVQREVQNLIAMVEDQYSGSFIITPAGEQIPEPNGWTLVEISKLALEMYGLTTALDQDNKTALYVDC